jgi:predicted regulator of Ras-like GTPase activity (Roadblock/LC7/MglB family)
MNRDPYVSAINNALTEIKKAYPAITNSFIFTNKGSSLSYDTEIEETKLKTLLESFEPLKEKTKSIGDFKNLIVNGKKGKITLTSIDNMYLGLITTEQAEESQIHFITNAIIPPLIKTLNTFSSSKISENSPLESLQKKSEKVPTKIPAKVPDHLQTPFTKTLIVDPFSGFFKGNSIQIDEELIEKWNKKSFSDNDIDEIKIETLDGNSSIYKLKKIKNKKLKEKNRVRIPEKICKKLHLKKGDRVNITPKF